MAKESFNWKGLFIKEDETTSSNEKGPAAALQENKFPTETFSNSNTALSNPFLSDILQVYEKGFESLNASGFDFFEMYKSVIAVGAQNPQSYQMAFAMGKSLKSDLTKEFLLEKAKFYIAEIEKVYAKNDAVGKTKKTDLENHIVAQKYNLSKTIEDLEARILQLQAELDSKKAEFQKIDIGNIQEFSEIQLKIEANNLAKNRILDSINTVVTGINQYL